MILKTNRLTLRPWQEEDAPALYQYAKSPDVGPVAGWPVHADVENSHEIIKDILSSEETYAIVLKNEDFPIGSIGLMLGEKSNLDIGNDEGEIGYWIGVPYWGQGLIPEAVQELIRHGFEDLGLKTIWCGYFDGNEKSRRVQEKCGFQYHHTEKDKEWLLMNDIRTEHISYITKKRWLTSHCRLTPINKGKHMNNIHKIAPFFPNGRKHSFGRIYKVVWDMPLLMMIKIHQQLKSW